MLLFLAPFVLIFVFAFSAGSYEVATGRNAWPLRRLARLQRLRGGLLLVQAGLAGLWILALSGALRSLRVPSVSGGLIIVVLLMAVVGGAILFGAAHDS